MNSATKVLTYSIALAISLATSFASLNAALAGAEGSANGGRGGGGTLTSEPAQIKKALRDLKESGLARAFERVSQRLELVTDPAARMAFERIFNSTGATGPDARDRGMRILYNEIQASTYGFQDAPCRDEQGEEKDASAKIGNFGGVICFSYSRIKRIGSAALPSEMLALAAHEHAHHLGLNELEAQAIQNFFIRHPSIVRHNVYSGMLANRVGGLGWHINIAERQLKAGDSDVSLCRTLGQLEGVAESMSYSLAVYESHSSPLPFEEPPASEDVQVMIHDTYVDAHGISEFCGKDPEGEQHLGKFYPVGRTVPPLRPLAIGDRAALASRLKELRQHIDKFEYQLDHH